MIYLHGIRKRGDNLLPKYYEVKTDVHCSHYKSTKHKEHELGIWKRGDNTIQKYYKVKTGAAFHW
jgi:hypothetical protein